jgi:hypothetical protein
LCAQLLGIATRTIYRRLEEDRDGTVGGEVEGGDESGPVSGTGDS